MNINIQEHDREALKELMTHAELYANQLMRSTGQVPPALFIQTLDGPMMLRPGNSFDERGRDDFAATARLACIAHGATATVMVAESWLKMAKPGQRLDLSVPPSQSPDRQEIVALMGETRFGLCQKSMPILRAGDGRFIGFREAPTIEGCQARGRFAQFLPERYPDLETQREAQELLHRKQRGHERRGDEEKEFAM